jgi:hypothetical protein
MDGIRRKAWGMRWGGRFAFSVGCGGFIRSCEAGAGVLLGMKMLCHNHG